MVVVPSMLLSKDGKATKIEPDREHPVSKCYTCKKTNRFVALQYYSERLLYPQRRAETRGEGRWEPIS